MNWYSTIKTALRGNIEMINNPDQTDPYRRNRPENGEGWDLNRLGDESGSTGSSSVGGTNARGKGYPRGWSSRSGDYEKQMNRDIPNSNHMFVSDHDETMLGSGQNVDSTKKQDFTDDRDKLPLDSMTWSNDPKGPVNMQSNLGWKSKKSDNLFRRIKPKLKGAYSNG